MKTAELCDDKTAAELGNKFIKALLTGDDVKIGGRNINGACSACTACVGCGLYAVLERSLEVVEIAL